MAEGRNSEEIWSDSLLDPPTQENQPEQTNAERVALRNKYRELIAETQQNKEELVKPDNKDLVDCVKQANQLFKQVKGTREAALDFKLLTLTVSIGAEKTNALNTDLVAFHSDEFMLKLVTLMGGSVSPEDRQDITIPNSGWETLGRETTEYFKGIVPALQPLLGTLDIEKKPSKERMKPTNDKPGKLQHPSRVTDYEEGKEEATPQEIEKVFQRINIMYKEYQEPIDYFELVINPQSCKHTIENIFHLAFLAKDNLVKISLNEHGLPVVKPLKGKSSKSKKETEICSQFMPSLSMEEWQILIEVYQLKGKKPNIKPMS